MNTSMLQVNEVFTSIQGEGYWTGVMADFIRLQGCTVGCEWCDTKYTWAGGGIAMEVTDILLQIKTPHVVITGGEPTLYNLDILISRLQALGKFVQLETSGQNELKGIVYPDWITISPKENLTWTYPYMLGAAAHEFKWVIEPSLRYSILSSTWANMQKNGSNPYFTLMPEGSPPKQVNVTKAIHFLRMANNSMWRYTDRIQTRIGVK